MKCTTSVNLAVEQKSRERTSHHLAAAAIPVFLCACATGTTAGVTFNSDGGPVGDASAETHELDTAHNDEDTSHNETGLDVAADAFADHSNGDADANTNVGCDPESIRCEGDQAQSCNGVGSSWMADEQCAQECVLGLCAGSCTPGARRCNGSSVELCSALGNAWNSVEHCAHSCHRTSATCTLTGLTVSSTLEVDGALVLSGSLVVRAGGILRSPHGLLDIQASEVVVEEGGIIEVLPTGTSLLGKGGDGSKDIYYYGGGGGGGYGTKGTSGGNLGGAGGPVFGNPNASVIEAGARGGNGYAFADSGGLGGGILRISAQTIDLRGSVFVKGQDGKTAPEYGKGGGGGGSGGGVILAADHLKCSGSISTEGGKGGGSSISSYTEDGGPGGTGRIKLLYGSQMDQRCTVVGEVTEGFMPPLRITSLSHPNENRVYNDGAPELILAWERPAPSTTGYAIRIGQEATLGPSKSDPVFVSETASIDSGLLRSGVNFVSIAAVDSKSDVGRVYGILPIRINAEPPSLGSDTHPNQNAIYTSKTAKFHWTFPNDDADVRGVYVRLDSQPSTMPTEADAFVAAWQKESVQTIPGNGTWYFHMVSVDTRGIRTKKASHYAVRISGS